VGVVSSQAERGKKAAAALLVDQNYYGDRRLLYTQKQGQQRISPRNMPGLALCGRLDESSSGLLLFTQDGAIANRIINAKIGSEVEKEYIVSVKQFSSMTAEDARTNPFYLQDSRYYHQRDLEGLGRAPPPPVRMGNDASLNSIRHNLVLDGQLLKPCKVEWLSSSSLQFTLREGKKHQIRRMCALGGLMVTSIHRTRIGRLQLGSLPIGRWSHVINPEESIFAGREYPSR
jgi:23S rRNA pseudouridine2604 synthase